MSTERERFGVLALDLGITTGWSVYYQPLGVKGRGCTTGVFHLPPKDATGNGHRFRVFEAWLEDQVRYYSVAMICYEKVLPKHKSSAQAALSNGLRASIEKIAATYQLTVEHIHNQTLKKWATGSGRADKQDVMRAALRRWKHDPVWKSAVHKPLDDNQVDSLWVLNWACHTFLALECPWADRPEPEQSPTPETKNGWIEKASCEVGAAINLLGELVKDADAKLTSKLEDVGFKLIYAMDDLEQASTAPARRKRRAAAVQDDPAQTKFWQAE